MLNLAMEGKLKKGECLDLSGCKRLPNGDYIVTHFVDGLDYCDKKSEQWIWSIGRRKSDGEVHASITGRYYQNDAYECIWLR